MTGYLDEHGGVRVLLRRHSGVRHRASELVRYAQRFNLLRSRLANGASRRGIAGVAGEGLTDEAR